MNKKDFVLQSAWNKKNTRFWSNLYAPFACAWVCVMNKKDFFRGYQKSGLEPLVHSRSRDLKSNIKSILKCCVFNKNSLKYLRKSMSDIFDKKKRSEIMSSVRSQNNKSTELRLIKLFKELNIKGWRRNYKVEGKPDFVFLEKKIAVFVDGCFWHGHDCRNVTPADNNIYWDNKRMRNKLRDSQINERFKSRGWTVIRIWECELTNKRKEKAVSKLQLLLYVQE